MSIADLYALTSGFKGMQNLGSPYGNFGDRAANVARVAGMFTGNPRFAMGADIYDNLFGQFGGLFNQAYSPDWSPYGRQAPGYYGTYNAFPNTNMGGGYLSDAMGRYQQNRFAFQQSFGHRGAFNTHLGMLYRGLGSCCCCGPYA